MTDRAIAIFGGGFGLYGYLPAVAAIGARAILPARHSERVNSRADLAPYRHLISWADDENDALGQSTAAILAVPPIEQPRLAENCLKHANIQFLMLEKPLGASPFLARELSALLSGRNLPFRIGYTFPLLSWSRKLDMAKDAIRIKWFFRAYHYANSVDTWKRRHAEGGGALRFYGIHLIALLAKRGYDDILDSAIIADGPGEAAEWRATITRPNSPHCEILISTDCDESAFIIEAGGRTIASLTDPFETLSAEPGKDRRADLLATALDDLFAGAPAPAWYADTIALWQRIENKTVII